MESCDDEIYDEQCVTPQDRTPLELKVILAEAPVRNVAARVKAN